MGYVLFFAATSILAALLNWLTKKEEKPMSHLEETTLISKAPEPFALTQQSIKKVSKHFNVVTEYLNQQGFSYVVCNYGNRIDLDLSNETSEYYLYVHMNPESDIVMYSIKILSDFPDERLHKLTELIVRINNYFTTLKFSMIMESRIILMKIPINTYDTFLTKELHDKNISWLMNTYDKTIGMFTSVAYDDVEPISAVMDLN